MLNDAIMQCLAKKQQFNNDGKHFNILVPNEFGTHTQIPR